MREEYHIRITAAYEMDLRYIDTPIIEDLFTMPPHLARHSTLRLLSAMSRAVYLLFP